ncbi:hypothetical protein FBUS_03712 [Fasciolopsis buskii]|uniref:Uncharacterized protein n=1 Tax=Fasciolopsis buskii TaxID=27845 RepID=A0A8E0VN74_9TREM|nr:hypothetical protein FBUS_03712 [Fasciolopsis buski]
MVQYPGISETRERFRPHPRAISEVLDNHGRLRPCKPGYRINPNYETRLPGWNKREEKEPEPAEPSEYARSYVWPDGSLIHPAPWNRSRLSN